MRDTRHVSKGTWGAKMPRLWQVKADVVLGTWCLYQVSLFKYTLGALPGNFWSPLGYPRFFSRLRGYGDFKQYRVLNVR